MNSLDTPAGSYHFSPEGLRLLPKCPLCSEEYQPFQARILEEKPEAQLVHITCRSCESSIVALIVNGQLGLTSVSLITDLSPEDVNRFKDASPISEEAVFAAYKEFQGDVQLLRSNLSV